MGISKIIEHASAMRTAAPPGTAVGTGGAAKRGTCGTSVAMTVVVPVGRVVVEELLEDWNDVGSAAVAVGAVG